MEMWTEVRRRVLTREITKRAACKEYGLHWTTLRKILEHVEPPGYGHHGVACEAEARPVPSVDSRGSGSGSQ